MKIISLLIATAIAISTQAQIEKVSFQASGLTCSMCSNSIFKALKTLDFVERVDVDLSSYTFEMTFKDKGSVEFDKIKAKVEGAGFSIISFIATVDFKNISIPSTDPLAIGNNRIVFVDFNQQDLKGIRQIRILDKGFVSSKEFRKRKFSDSEGSIYHAAI